MAVFYVCDTTGKPFTGDPSETMGDFCAVAHDCPKCKGQASKGRTLAWLASECKSKGAAKFPCMSCGTFLVFPQEAFKPAAFEELSHHFQPNALLRAMSPEEALKPDWWAILFRANGVSIPPGAVAGNIVCAETAATEEAPPSASAQKHETSPPAQMHEEKAATDVSELQTQDDLLNVAEDLAAADLAPGGTPSAPEPDSAREPEPFADHAGHEPIKAPEESPGEPETPPLEAGLEAELETPALEAELEAEPEMPALEAGLEAEPETPALEAGLEAELEAPLYTGEFPAAEPAQPETPDLADVPEPSGETEEDIQAAQAASALGIFDDAIDEPPLIDEDDPLAGIGGPLDMEKPAAAPEPPPLEEPPGLEDVLDLTSDSAATPPEPEPGPEHTDLHTERGEPETEPREPEAELGELDLANPFGELEETAPAEPVQEAPARPAGPEPETESPGLELDDPFGDLEEDTPAEAAPAGPATEDTGAGDTSLDDGGIADLDSDLFGEWAPEPAPADSTTSPSMAPQPADDTPAWDGTGPCPKCGSTQASKRSIKVQCPHCATLFLRKIEDFSTAADTSINCPRCTREFIVPAAIWCPVCRRMPRPFAAVQRLVTEANPDSVAATVPDSALKEPKHKKRGLFARR